MYRSTADKRHANYLKLWSDVCKVRVPERCQIATEDGCLNEANRGGHMYLRGGGQDYYILPICASHNGLKDLDAVDGKAPKWVRTKPTAMFVQLPPSAEVQAAQHDDEWYKAEYEADPGSVLRNLRDESELDRILSGRRGEALVMLVMDGCIWCAKLEPKFARYAARTKVPAYVFNEKYSQDGCQALQTELHGTPLGFPEVIHVFDGSCESIEAAIR